MITTNTYLNFPGTCKEAFSFYEKLLGGKIIAMMPFEGSPMASDPAWNDKIIHARMTLGDNVIMGSDAQPSHFKTPQGFSVNIGTDNPAEADRIFVGLSRGGETIMPIQETFWAHRFGMCVDRFGIPGWSIAKRRCEMNAPMKIYAERSVTITRILKAPRYMVWRAWTDHAQLKEWWGPENFTNPVVDGDIKVGGTLHITMHGPKGSPFDVDMPMVKRYKEIVPGKKLVFENEPIGPKGERMMDSLTTVTFADHPDGTLMEMTTHAKALTEQSVGFLGGMEQGWGQSFDRLARLLAA